MALWSTETFTVLRWDLIDGARLRDGQPLAEARIALALAVVLHCHPL